MTVSNFIKITEQGLLDGNSPHSLVAKEVITLTRQGFDYCLTVMPIFFRGVRCDAVFSPSFSATPHAPTFGVTPKILSATPDYEVPQAC